MSIKVIMPQMGESIFEGTITKWLKKVGDRVERDEPLFEISTDKVDAEIPAPHAAVLGIPVDEGTTQHPGARYGPRAIREASTQYAFYRRGRGYHDVEADRPMLAELELRDAGDVEVVPTLLDETFARIGEGVRALASRGVLPVCLGGEHSVTLPIVRALASLPGEGEPLHMIQVDAHLDFVDRLDGAERTHASPMRRIAELPGVRGWAQIGARSIVSTAADLRAARAFWAHLVPGDRVAAGRLEIPPPPPGAFGWTSRSLIFS